MCLFGKGIIGFLRRDGRGRAVRYSREQGTTTRATVSPLLKTSFYQR